MGPSLEYGQRGRRRLGPFPFPFPFPFLFCFLFFRFYFWALAEERNSLVAQQRKRLEEEGTGFVWMESLTRNCIIFEIEVSKLRQPGTAPSLFVFSSFSLSEFCTNLKI